ncbi:MAG TPA: rRNA maturation RNase YbeY [Baekduia sp.]|nr:rRNA maturation RNase YbeY [Baekduia sp.]
MRLEVEVIGREFARSAPQDLEISRLAVLAAASAGIEDGHVAIEFVDEERIAELNDEHRDKPEPTDVLSFPIDSGDDVGGGPRELGDVVICESQTEDIREAVVHGVLHLVGMDHETDQGEMLAVQAEIMSWG